MKAEIKFEHGVNYNPREIHQNIDITYDGPISPINNMVSESTVEIILGDIYKGLSAYQIAVKNGFKGSEEDWLNSLKYQPTVLTQQEYDSIQPEEDKLYFIYEE